MPSSGQTDPLFAPDASLMLSATRPKAMRWRAAWVPQQRIADYRRLFDYYIDLVEDPDFSLQKDPNAHEKMMRDGQISGAVRVRQLAVASRQILFIPKTNDAEHLKYAEWTAQVWSRLRRKNEAVLNIMEAVPRGLSVQEILWRVDDQLRLVPSEMYPVHKDRFAFNLENELVLRGTVDVFYGEALPPYTFLAHRFDQDPGGFNSTRLEGRIAFGRGLFDRLYPLFFWKTILLRLAMRFAEQYADPYKIGRFPPNNVEAKAAMDEALKNLIGGLHASIPAGPDYDIKFEQPPVRGQVVYSELLNYIDNQIVKMVLGTVLVMDTGGQSGSYTLGASHERTTFGRITQYDSASLCDTLEHSLVRWIFQVNRWPLQFMPTVTQSSGEVGNVIEQVETLLTLADRGYPVSVEMISDRTGIRTMRPGETPLAMMTPQPQGGINIDTGEGSFKPSHDPFENAGRKGFSLNGNGKRFIPDVYPE